MDGADGDMASTICDLAVRNSDLELLAIAARMSIDCGLLDRADRICDLIMDIEPGIGESLHAEILLRRNRTSAALDDARSGYRGDTDSDIILGMCLLETNHTEEARECLGRALESMMEKGCLFGLDRLLHLQAVAEMRLNRRDAALEILRTALSVCHNERHRSELLDLGRSLQGSEDCVALQ